MNKLNWIFSIYILALIPANLIAQDAKPIQCIKDEYVITVSKVSALRKKAVDALDSVSKAAVVVNEESPQVLLLEEKIGGDLDNKPVSYSSKRDLCVKLKENRREKLRVSRASDTVEMAPRRISCSCNGVLSLDSYAPRDPLATSQWAITQNSDIDMNLDRAWDLHTGTSDTVIAVIDTGIDYNHPDLAANIWTNPNEIPGNNIDDDGNGWVDDIHGINSINSSGNPMDDHGHGTHVAGTIGAVGANNLGVTGVNWQVKMVGAKFLSSTGSGSLYDAVRCVDYVTGLKLRGVNVILSNNSWGGGGYWSVMYDSINRAKAAGILFVAAAGNSNQNTDTSPAYPAGYNLDNVISVGAATSTGQRASFSNHGVQSVDISAPGVDIISTYPGSRYAWMSGTSMASPHISGALALAASYNFSLNYAQLRDALYTSSRRLSGLDYFVTGGRFVDTYALLAQVGAPIGPRPTPTMTGTPTPLPTATRTATPSPTATATATPVPGYYRLSGTVTNGSKPMVAVKIKLKTQHVDLVRYTDFGGRYSFEEVLGPTDFTLQAESSGHTFQPFSSYLNQHTSIDFVGSVRNYALLGKVVNKDQAGVAGVTITLNDTQQVDSGVDGSFSFVVPYGSSYKLRAASTLYDIQTPELIGEMFGDVGRVFVAVDKEE